MPTAPLNVKFGTEGFAKALSDVQNLGKAFDKTLDDIRRDIEAAGKAKQEALDKGPVDQKAAAAADDVLVRRARAANKLIADSFKELRLKATSELDAQRASAQAAYRAIEKAYRDGIATSQDLARAQQALTARLEEIDRAAAPLPGRFENAAAGAERAATRVNLLREGLQLLAGVVGVLTLDQLAQKFFEVGVQGDTAKRMVSTLTSDADGLTKTIRQLADDLDNNVNSTELLTGAYDVLSSGFTKNADVVEILGASTKSAIGGGVKDSAVVVDAVTTVLNSYGRSAKDATLLTDQFAQTVAAGKLRMEDYAGQIGNVASTAALAKVRIEQVNAVVATATFRGVKPEAAFTAVGQALSAILKPSSEASKLAKELGIEFNAAALASKGFIGLLEDIREKGGGTAENLSVLFGSVEAVRGIAPLFADGLKLVKENLEAQGQAAGTAEAQYQKMAAGAGQAIKRVQNVTIELANQLFEAFGPDIQSQVDGFSNAIRAAKDNTEQIAGAARLLFEALKALLIMQTVSLVFREGGAAVYLFYSAVTTAEVRTALLNRTLVITKGLFGGLPGVIGLAVLALGQWVLANKEANEANAALANSALKVAQNSAKASIAQINQANVEAVIALDKVKEELKQAEQTVLNTGGRAGTADVQRLQAVAANIEKTIGQLRERRKQIEAEEAKAAASAASKEKAGSGGGGSGPIAGTVGAIKAQIEALQKSLDALDPKSAKFRETYAEIERLQALIADPGKGSSGANSAASLARSAAETRLKEIRLGLEKERAELDRSYGQGLIDLQTYYSRREDLAKRDIAAQVAAKQVELAAVQKEAVSAATPAERTRATQAAQALQVEIKAISQKGAEELLKLKREQGKAQEAEARRQVERQNRLEEEGNAIALEDLRDQFQQRLIGYEEFYRREAQLQQQAIDQKIRRNQQEIDRLSTQAGTPDERAQALDQINRLETENLVLQGQREQAGVRAERSIRDAVIEQQRALIDLRTRLGEGTEGGLQARFAQIDEAYREQLEKFIAEGNKAGEEIVRALIQKDKLQEAFSQATSTFRVREGELQNRLGQIDILRQQGAIDQVEAQNRINQVNREYAAILQQVYEQLLAVAEASGDPRLKQQAEALRLTIEQLKIPVNDLAKEINTKLRDSLADALTEAATGAKSLGDALLGVLRNFLSLVNQAASKRLAELIFPTQGKGDTGGIGGFLAGLFGGGFARGGEIEGPGTETSDSIPAVGPGGKVYAVSKGEWIVPAAAARAVGATFMRNLIGLQVNRRAEGGPIGEALTGGGGGPAVRGGGTRIINVVDPALVSDYLSSAAGEKTVLNVIERNPQTIQRLIGA